jgi:hypothetical protein
LGLWLFAIVWNGISLPAAIAAWPRILDGERPLFFVLLFPAAGLWLIGAAARRQIQRRKFGRVRFLPASVPGKIGGYLGGVIEVPARLEPEGDVRLSLSCVRREVRGSGKNRSVHESVQWETEARVARDRWKGGRQRAEIPVLLPIEGGLPPTEVTTDDTRILWRLKASAAVRGIDFSTSFEVPVFSTGNESVPPDRGQPALDVYRSGPPTESAMREAGVLPGRQPNSFVFASRHLRSAKIVMGLLAAGLLPLEIALVRGGAPWVALVVVGLFALICLFAAVDVILSRYSVAIETVAVAVTRRGVLGPRTTRVPRDNVADIRTERSMSIGATEYHRLVLMGRAGVDPLNPGPGEPCAARKLRYQLRRAMKELGVADPAHGGGRTAAIVKDMARVPGFEVTIAGHIPDLATARSIAEMLLGRIRER